MNKLLLFCLMLMFSVSVNASNSKIVYIGATWCGACNYAKPFIDKFKKDNKNVNFEVYYFDKLDDESKNKLFDSYEVGASIPKYFFIRNGKKIARVGGALNEVELNCLYQRFIKLNKKYSACKSIDSRYIFLY